VGWQRPCCGRRHPALPAASLPLRRFAVLPLRRVPTPAAFASMACSRPTPGYVPRSFHPRGAKQAPSLCLAFRARRSTPITRPMITATHPITRRQLASAGPSCSNGCSLSILNSVPTAGVPLKIIAAIVDPTVIAKILAHLGLPARAPPRAPARPFALLPTALLPTARFPASRPPHPVHLPEPTTPLGPHSHSTPKRP
jgi:hypothetical protein